MHKNKIKDLLKTKNNRLDISGCKLSEIPKDLQKNLEKVPLQILELDLSFNQFSKVDLKDLSSDFNSLNVLSFSGNPSLHQITFQGRSEFKYLNELNLSGCKINSLTDTSFHGLVSLRKLNIANSQLETVHERSFSQFKSTLEEINLSGNSNLKTVPLTLLDCSILEIVDLSSCGIRSLPSGFGQGLASVLELNLGNNRLSTLPNSIGRMKRLCLLNLQDNSITSLPLSIGHCVGLAASGSTGGGINLFGNPLSDDYDLKSKISQGPGIIMDYLEKKMSLHRGPISLSDSSSENNSPILMSSSPGPDYSAVAGPKSIPLRPPPYQYTTAVPIKDRLTELLTGEIKKKIQVQYDIITKSQTAEDMIAIGNKITSIQEDLDKLVNSLKIQKEFIFISPKPLPNEEKLIQIKKILHLKLEKLVLYIKHLVEYVTLHVLPQNFKSIQDFDNLLLFIYDSIQKVNFKWNF